MCGITGAVNTTFRDGYHSVLKHRGPDDGGCMTYQNTMLAHCRLSILDTSSLGHQPMQFRDSGFSIVFNGEIYNHAEIREELEKEGYLFESGTDTETLLKGWHCWGEDVLQKLNGIFAFAILDEKRDLLYLVRDHFGIKPLYIYEKDGTLAFASELKVFGHLTEFDDTLQAGAFMQYLSLLWAPGTQTPYKYVKKLLPGHCVKVPLSDVSGKVEKQYYRLPFEGDYLEDASEEQMITRLDTLLKQSVERQLLSDVPLGFFLSGGLDSSLLVAIARHLYPEMHFDCFTIASNMQQEGKGFVDDLPFARRVADHLSIDLHVVNANYDIINQFDHMIWHLDEPQADPAPINVFNISKGASERGIKVLLGGTAGDDLFSGYRRHQALGYDRIVEQIPVKMRTGLQAGVHAMPGNGPMVRKLQKLSRDWEKPMTDRMLGYFNWMPNDAYVLSLFNNDAINGHSADSVYSYFKGVREEQKPGLSTLDQLLYLEIKTFLVDHNLNYTDKMSMAAGVEARVPYLDKDLVRFAGRIPSEMKLRKGETKYILKKVAERYLPADVIYRSKTGFGAPVRSWLKNELRPMVKERLDSRHLSQQGIFDPAGVQKMVEQNQSGQFDLSYPVWGMLAIQSWLEQFKWSL